MTRARRGTAARLPDPAPDPRVLLADPSACLRSLVLRRLLKRPDSDSEVRELEPLRRRDPLALRVLAKQRKDGSWLSPGEDRFGQGALAATSVALSRLAFLGFGPGDPAVRRAAEWLFGMQLRDGSWPLGGEGREEGRTYTMMPLQTALPLGALARAGYAEDPRSERAYGWLLARRLGDGAWPTGLASGVHGYVAGYRKLSHSLWGCRSNTTASLICLSRHPARRRSPEALRALDHLLGRETREKATLGFEAARLAGFGEARGFITFHAVHDPAVLLELAARCGATAEDGRVADLAAFVEAQRGPFGAWAYAAEPAASGWVGYALWSALEELRGNRDAGAAAGEPASPRTPFRAYPKGPRRF